ncbi:ABC transporter permease [Paenibacillus sp. JX-17]|uniref:ABC transporter permease n=1 Tax=Paenibacillus lacisoli TaxID=3064525 RepID=A0ABT9CBZ2_9BACL|nr:ABC transporter permease [Paenibacillus sp. JX-17]MDO7906757.1 ABC transporter permease [Paenibacillus sp. JX-17]
MISTYFRLLSTERLKLMRSPVWLLLLISPAIALLLGVTQGGGAGWPELLLMMVYGHALLFLPIMTGVLGAFVCRFEHAGGGWKQLLVLPVSRTGLYIAKFTVIMLMLAILQLLFLGAVLAAGWFLKLSGPLPWFIMAKSLMLGWIACMPLAALQLLVSFLWSSFAAPLALNIALTIPNMLIINSQHIGPLYPWAQPLLLMIPSGGEQFGAFQVPLPTIFTVVICSLALCMGAGWFTFNRKEI